MVLFTVTLVATAGATEAEPTCFPISDAVRTLAYEGRLGGQVVFVEEHSACVGAALAPVAVEPPEGLVGRDALLAVLGERGGDYAVSDQPAGLRVAPTAGTTILDYHVTVAAGRVTVIDARVDVFGQLARDAKIWIPPGEVPGYNT